MTTIAWMVLVGLGLIGVVVAAVVLLARRLDPPTTISVEDAPEDVRARLAADLAADLARRRPTRRL